MGLIKRPELDIPTEQIDVKIEAIKNDNELSEKEKRKQIKKLERKQAFNFIKKGGKIFW